MSNKTKNQKKTVNYSRNVTEVKERKSSDSRILPLVYLVYYSVAGIVTSLVFSLLRLSMFDNLLFQLGIVLVLTAVVSIFPIMLMIRSRAPISMYIIAPLCNFATGILAAFNIFTIGLVISGVLLGALLAFIYSGFSLNNQALSLIVLAACIIISAGYAVYSSYKFVVKDGLNYRLDNGSYTLVEAVPIDNQVLVPSEVNGFAVKRVASNAFERYGEDIWNLDIPSGITVPRGTLYPCVNILALGLDFSTNGIYYFFGSDIPADIGDATFTNVPMSLKGVKAYGKDICYDAFIYGTITELVVSDEVERIGDGAFQSNIGLTTVTLGKNVMFIGIEAFGDCYSLYTVNMKDSKLEHISAYAFTRCNVLNAPTFPSTLKRIDSYAFSFCTAFASSSFLIKVKIPGSVEFMGSYAFYGATQYSYNSWAELCLEIDWPFAPVGWAENWDALLMEDDGETISMRVNADFKAIEQ